MKKLLSSIIFLWMSVVVASAQGAANTAPATAPDVGIHVVNCASELPLEEAHCAVRMPIGATFERIEGSQDATFDYIPITNSKFPQNVSLGSTLFLLDTSIGANALRRSQHFNREKDVIKAFLSALPEGTKVALATFHEQGSLKIVQDFTLLHSRIETSLDEVKLEGLSTHISEAVREGVKVLANQNQTLIKNVVVFSDGEEEGVDATAEVKAFAVENQVAISAVSLYLRSPGASETGFATNYLNRLTDDSFGVFAAIQASRNPLDAEALKEVESAGSDLAKSVVRSGLVMSQDDFESAPFTIIVNEPLAGYEGVTKPVGYTVTMTNDGYVAPKPEPTPETPEQTTTPGEGARSGGGASGFDLMALFDDYAYLFIGGAVALLLLIIILVLSLSGGKKKRPEEKPVSKQSSAAATSMEFSDPVGSTGFAPAPPVKPLAFIHVKGTQHRLDILAPSVTLGRTAPSDVCIDHPSVSRQHAALRLSSNGAFISDLDSTNGIKIDGKRVSREIEIRSGTVISLGKCEVIFSLA